MATSREQNKDVLSSGAGLAADVAAESGGVDPLLTSPAQGAVQARGYWEQVWRRFRRDRLALASAVFIILFVFTAIFGGPIAAHFLGHGPNDIFTDGTDPATYLPKGPMSVIHYPDAEGNIHSTLFILGADSTLGRDEFLRLLYGARVSLEVAVLATMLGVGVGVAMGAIAGFFGGWMDVVVSRLTEVVMAFPQLLFIIAIAGTIGPRLNSVTLGIFPPGILTLVLIIGGFSWYYPARIIRGLVLSLREKEFVEAARMVGAGDRQIIKSHLLPHLVAPTLVYSTLIIATNVLAEAGLSFLGLGIPLPTASWGNLLSTAPQYYTTQPWLMIWPGLAVLFTVLAFNLLGDGLRDAFDPRGVH